VATQKARSSSGSAGNGLLTGTFVYGMDKKGRVVMPARFRRQLGAPFVLTRAPGRSLLALSSPQWDTLVHRYEKSVLFRGYYLTAAVTCPVDEHTGRFLIPHVLREYAELRPMDEVAISGIGKAVQVARNSLWKEQVASTEFPSLGQLDLDLEVPHPDETRPYRQKQARPLGIGLIECQGRMGGRAIRRLATAILKLVEAEAPVIVLDLRKTGETQTGLSLVMNLVRGQLASRRLPLWVVAHGRGLAEEGVEVFADLEKVLWRLGNLKPRRARRRRAAKAK